MTKHECAIVTAYTGITMLKGDDLSYLYQYLSSIVGRPVYTHELSKVCDLYKDTTIKNDFLALCRTATEDKNKGGE